MKNYYKRFYSKFDEALPQADERLRSGRKPQAADVLQGHEKQVSVICGVCSGTDYLFCDEDVRWSRPGRSPDGKEPVCRGCLADRGLTPIIASHNLRELEDICDHVGLLHRGGILFSRDLDDMKLGMYKMQCIFPNPAAGFRLGRL